MNAKAALVLCASALLIQSVLGRCGCGCGGMGYDGLGYGGMGYDGLGYVGLGYDGLGASYGGGLVVVSSSAIPPVGLMVSSNNGYEGCVGVCGNLPFLGTAVVEGAFPTDGLGGVSYGCGDGALGITNEGGYSGSAGYQSYGLGYEGYDLGYGGYGIGGCGCGCNGGLMY